MKKLTLTILVLLVYFVANSQNGKIHYGANTGESDPTPEFNWEDTKTGKISEWVDKYSGGDGYYSVVNGKGDIDTIYVKNILTKKEYYSYEIKYHENYYAPRNRNWMNPKMKTKLWFYKWAWQRWNTLESVPGIEKTVGFDAACGNPAYVKRFIAKTSDDFVYSGSRLKKEPKVKVKKEVKTTFVRERTYSNAVYDRRYAPENPNKCESPQDKYRKLESSHALSKRKRRLVMGERRNRGELEIAMLKLVHENPKCLDDKVVVTKKGNGALIIGGILVVVGLDTLDGNIDGFGLFKRARSIRHVRY